MNSKIKYLLDANVFIEAHRRYYSFDIVPAFWEALVKYAENNQLISIDRIKQEIRSPNEEDDLQKWINTKFDSWFMSTDKEDIIESYREIINWAYSQTQYQEYAKREFAEVADSWLIAYAKTYNCTIVTHEQFNPEKKNRIPIPNVCEEFDITCIDTFEMLRRLNARLG